MPCPGITIPLRSSFYEIAIRLEESGPAPHLEARLERPDQSRDQRRQHQQQDELRQNLDDAAIIRAPRTAAARSA